MDTEKIRILICHTDGAVLELPWYEGPPDHDDTLNYRLAEHKFPDGSAHFGNLFVYNKDDWAKSSVRDAILNEIAKQVRPGEGTGLGQTFYDVKDNFQQDAITCWKKHNRTLDCGDYMTDRMRLYPDTKADRKELGLSVKERPNTFLCQFCPVDAHVQTKKNKEIYG
jgi:hypothetical protein